MCDASRFSLFELHSLHSACKYPDADLLAFLPYSMQMEMDVVKMWHILSKEDSGDKKVNCWRAISVAKFDVFGALCEPGPSVYTPRTGDRLYIELSYENQDPRILRKKSTVPDYFMRWRVADCVTLGGSLFPSKGQRMAVELVARPAQGTHLLADLCKSSKVPLRPWQFRLCQFLCEAKAPSKPTVNWVVGNVGTGKTHLVSLLKKICGSAATACHPFLVIELRDEKLLSRSLEHASPTTAVWILSNHSCPPASLGSEWEVRKWAITVPNKHLSDAYLSEFPHNRL